MGELNRKVEPKRRSFFHLINEMKTSNRYWKAFVSAFYIFILSSLLAGLMIMHYCSVGQWSMDSMMQGMVKAMRTPWLDGFFRGITATGETVPVIIFTSVIVIALIAKKRRLEAATMAVYMIGVWRLNETIKGWLHRPRPAASLHLVEISGYSHSNQFSMPSGHAMNFIALTLLTLYILWVTSKNKKRNAIITAILLPYALLVGFSRIYLNVHFSSDVITGWSLGLACAAAAVMFHSILAVKQSKKNLNN